MPDLTRWENLRLDRVLIRVAVGAVMVVTLLSTTGVTSDARPELWRIALGVCGGVALVAGFVTGGSWWAQDGANDGGWSTGRMVAMSGGALAMDVALPGASVIWIAYVPLATIARSTELRRAVPLLAPPLVGLAYACSQTRFPQQSLLLNLAAALGVVIVLQQRRRQIESAELAAAQEQVIARERQRAEQSEQQREVAAQVHDVLAHTLSGLIVSLQTARLQARQEGASPDLQERLEAATGLAREGLRGARDAVESLHAAASTRAIPFADWLGPTLSQARDATAMQITVDGDPHDVPARWWGTAEAVVREALTNSLRHAPGLPVSIGVSPVSIEVRTIGSLENLPATDQISGRHGLAGLRRRVEGAGGQFSAGPDEQGWRVMARWEQR